MIDFYYDNFQVRLELQEKLDCDLTERKKEVDQLVMEVIDEQTQEDDEEDEEGDGEDEEEESESEDESPKRKKKKPVARKKADSESGSAYSPDNSEDEDEVPSDGGGSDYEPDEPIGRIGRGKVSKKKSRRDSDDESSGEEWGGRKKSSSKKGRKRRGSSEEDDSDYEKPKPKAKRSSKGNGYTAPVKLSSELADIVGGDEMPRHEVS